MNYKNIKKYFDIYLVMFGFLSFVWLNNFVYFLINRSMKYRIVYMLYVIIFIDNVFVLILNVEFW